MESAQKQISPASAWLLKAFKVVNAAFPNIDWTVYGTLPDVVYIPPEATKDLQSIEACIKGQVLEPRVYRPEISKLQDNLDWALFTCFESDTFGQPSGNMDDVREAWRRYYKAHLPNTQQELLT